MNRNQFYPGQVLLGCVLANVHKPAKTKGISVKVQGYIRTEIETVYYNGLGVQMELFVETHPIFRNDAILYGSPYNNQKSTSTNSASGTNFSWMGMVGLFNLFTIPRLSRSSNSIVHSLPKIYTFIGSHAYHFCFCFPKDCPPSIKFGHSMVTYELCVKGPKGLYIRQPLFVCQRPLSLSKEIPHYYRFNRTSISGKALSLEASVSALRYTSNPIQFSVHGQAPRAIMKTPYTFKLTIVNSSNMLLYGFKVDLYYQIILTAQGHKEDYWRRWPVTSFNTIPGFPLARRVWEGEVSIMIPDCPVPTIKTPLIQLDWYLVFTPKFGVTVPFYAQRQYQSSLLIRLQACANPQVPDSDSYGPILKDLSPGTLEVLSTKFNGPTWDLVIPTAFYWKGKRKYIVPVAGYDLEKVYNADFAEDGDIPFSDLFTR